MRYENIDSNKREFIFPECDLLPTAYLKGFTIGYKR